MGLALSALITYAGVREALECVNHILSGMLPDSEPDFSDLIKYYTMLLQKSANPNTAAADWTRQCGQGYLSLTEDDEGVLKTAAVKYYDGQPDSTAILFSTKISSFGQESVEDSSSHANGDYRTERYTPTKTKTILTNSSESFSVGTRNRSPTSENISDHRFSEGSFERDSKSEDKSDASEKLTWRYRPKSPNPSTLPEIHLQSFEEDARGVKVYSEDYLRSLDGIKYRPLQRIDPSGRRRSFKKRHSSSSTSSRESRASREEELKMFTSLEEEEFERMNAERAGFGSTPNLATRSDSRSRSREKSNERTHSWDTAAPATDLADDLKPRLKDLPKLGSFEEKDEAKETANATEDEVDDDFWGNSGD